MNETWVIIKGFADYKISNFGNVISFKNKAPKILKFADSGRGYKSVWLSNDTESKRKTIHRLVAENFINNPYFLKEVNHIDGNKNNNIVSNLEWVSGIDNLKHAREVLGINKKGTNHHSAKLTEQDVISIINLYKTGNYTQKQIAEIYNVGSRNIQKITSRTRWRHLQIN